MKKFSVVITDTIHQSLSDHLIRHDEQEDLCFATYLPSSGNERNTAIITSIIFPEDGERVVHGNVGFLPPYLERVLSIALKKK